MNSFDTMLDRYAELVVKVGVNIQPGQTLVVNAALDSADLVRKIARKAYEAGAKHVHFEWNDDELTRLRYDMAPDEAFEEYPLWKARGYEEMAENGAAFLSIVASNPNLLKGVDSKRIATANRVASKAMDKYRNYTMSDQVSWTVISAPSAAWAALVFPDLPESERISALWNAIFKATRCDQENPIQAWHDHKKNLAAKVEHLNARKYCSLQYKAPGTDLTIELPKGHLWIGGGSVNKKGVRFTANMPTEEVFTAPFREGVNGVVHSTKPLSYQGNLIENFSITFEKGRIVEFTAESGQEALQRLVEMDEGSRYLGEVALVPDQSPISQSNTIFYNTLFDENASNHLAIGRAYPICLEGGTTMSENELLKHGLNNSLSHVDFMIGSAEMDIDGKTADGKLEPIFRKGNWAF